MLYALVFAVSLATAVCLTPLAQRLSFRWGAVAVPGGRRLHGRVMPILGGIPVFGAFMVGVALIYAFAPPTGEDANLILGILLGSVLVVAGGFLDDVREQPAWSQFAVQFVGAAIAIYFDVFIERFTNPLTNELIIIEPRWVAIGFTLFWIAGMMNTLNWLDGLDGLAAGVSTISALLFAWHSYSLGQTTVALFPLALAGALLGFLPFNFAPAKIFLGSAGAYFLGYSIATMSIIAPAKIATALLVLAIPILDVAWQIFNRLRHGRSPFQGDRGHLHFQLADRGWRTQTIVLGYYLVSLLLGLVAIFAPGLWKLLLFLGLATAVLLLFLWLSRQKKEDG
jgi:UDP-GlcNAc:undecaprenyl-phosphate/decaprenyl-phosphate GlcNAc-1-phosphate transferase